MNKKNLICIPFAYKDGMNSGVNISGGGKKLEIYLKNASVALVSAKQFNSDCDVAFATNLKEKELPNEFLKILREWDIQVLEIPYNEFEFPGDYTWSLAFYKLCVLKRISEMKYMSVCYLDTDVYIQGNFEAIWRECEQNVMLYDINHGLNTDDYISLCDEVEEFYGNRKLITHYGGEFFAASSSNAKEFVNVCEQVYSKMLEKDFRTTKGDEFILSVAAENMKASIKNAGAYVYRFWTGASFRLVSTCYEYNRIIVLHLPAEKEHGMLKMYDHYIRRGIVPSDKNAWRIFRLSKMPLADQGKRVLRNTVLKKV